MIVLWWIVSIAVIVFVFRAVLLAKSGGVPEALFASLMVGLILCGAMSVPVAGLTGGFMKTFSEGERVGYLVKISKRGVLFKTYDAEIQMGTGEQAALQEPFQFSIVDKELIEFARKNIGKKVEVKYTEFLLTDFRKSSNGYVVSEMKEGQ